MAERVAQPRHTSWTSVIKEERSHNCSMKAVQAHHQPAPGTLAKHMMKRQQSQGVRSTLNHEEESPL